MKNDDFIIIDGRIICSQEEWDKIADELLNIASTLNKNSFRGYYCEAENSYDKQCKKCKDEQ